MHVEYMCGILYILVFEYVCSCVLYVDYITLPYSTTGADTTRTFVNIGKLMQITGGNPAARRARCRKLMEGIRPYALYHARICGARSWSEALVLQFPTT